MRLLLKPYDVFISYVVEDREIVELLYDALTKEGLKVWYAKNELYPGAEIRPLVNRGIKNSRYGIAVITPSYKSHWAFGELFVLMQDKETLIPVLHNTNVEEVAREQPEVITRFCLNTTAGVENAATEIAGYVGRRSPIVAILTRAREWCSKHSARLMWSFFGVMLLALLFLALHAWAAGFPDEGFIEAEIRKRIAGIENSVQQEVQKDIILNDASVSSLEEILRTQTDFIKNTRYYRNRFDFYNGVDHIKTVAGLKNAGVLQREGKMEVPFGLTLYNAYLFKETQHDSAGLGYVFVSLLPLTHRVVDTRYHDGSYEVEVRYSNFLRYVEANISIDNDMNMRISHFGLLGTRPLETYVFVKKEGTWVLSSIR